MDAAPMWMVWGFPCMISSISKFIDICLALFLKDTTYCTTNDLKQTITVINAMSSQKSGKKLLLIGENFFMGCKLHTIFLTTKYFAICTVTGPIPGRCNADAKIRIWRFRGSLPIIPDPDPPRVASPNNDLISVLYCDSYGTLRTMSEVICPADMPCAVMARATKLVDDMEWIWRQGGGLARVFVVHGLPGSGKSISARMLAKRLDARFFGEYNLSDGSMNLHSILVKYVSGSERLVIVYEEFDVSIHGIVHGQSHQAVSTGDRVNLAIKDKRGWNIMLDTLKRVHNAVMVLTTNKSFKEVQALVDADRSMLHKGRVDAHFVLEDKFFQHHEPITPITEPLV